MPSPAPSTLNLNTFQVLLRGFLGFVLGMILGGCVNMGILIVGGKLVPMPAGVDINDIETIKAHINEYSVLQLSVPFAAHAGGTLVGAFVAALLAITRHSRIALCSLIGLLFLAGGTLAVIMIPAPTWFNTIDLVCAYLPMAWLGYTLARLLRR